MKKIKELLNCENGILDINEFVSLRRFQKDAFGNSVDKLKIEFSIISKFEKTVEIETRDVKEIIEIISRETRLAFNEASEKLVKNFKNGYNLGEIHYLD